MDRAREMNERYHLKHNGMQEKSELIQDYCVLMGRRTSISFLKEDEKWFPFRVYEKTKKFTKICRLTVIRIFFSDMKGDSNMLFLINTHYGQHPNLVCGAALVV